MSLVFPPVKCGDSSQLAKFPTFQQAGAHCTRPVVREAFQYRLLPQLRTVATGERKKAGIGRYSCTIGVHGRGSFFQSKSVSQKFYLLSMLTKCIVAYMLTVLPNHNHCKSVLYCHFSWYWYGIQLFVPSCSYLMFLESGGLCGHKELHLLARVTCVRVNVHPVSHLRN